MTDRRGPSWHVSYDQVKCMLDFMGQHVEFASGSLRSLEARRTSKRLWNDLTKILNNCRTGTNKSADGWSKYWSDFKNKLKNKVKILNERKKFGSTSTKGIRPLTKLEKRAVVILGPHFTHKITTDNGDSYVSSNSLPPEVKLEENEFRLNNDSHERLTDDGDRGSEESEEEMSNKEYAIDSDQNSNEPSLNNIYPKWLIEVEKKRADAELTRAKAEVERVSIAAKNAEAALIQAKAMKKLSEAASRQADAILRIATALENRGHSEDILAI